MEKFPIYNIKLLAFDTSTDACGAALYLNGTIFERFEIAPQKHTQILLPMIDDLLKEGEIQLKDLDALAIGRGPGSFTGLRIAVAIAQGLGYGINKPIVPISTLRALAQESYLKSLQQLHSLSSSPSTSPPPLSPQPTITPILSQEKNETSQLSHDIYESTPFSNIFAWLDARMHEIYWGLFSVDNDGYMQAASEEKVQDPNTIVLPNGEWHKTTGYPKPNIIALLACPEFLRGNVVTAADLRPVYLRNRVVHTKD